MFNNPQRERRGETCKLHPDLQRRDPFTRSISFVVRFLQPSRFKHCNVSQAQKCATEEILVRRRISASSVRIRSSPMITSSVSLSHQLTSSLLPDPVPRPSSSFSRVGIRSSPAIPSSVCRIRSTTPSAVPARLPASTHHRSESEAALSKTTLDDISSSSGPFPVHYPCIQKPLPRQVLQCGLDEILLKPRCNAAQGFTLTVLL